MLGKVWASSIRVKQVFLLGGFFLLAHGRMTTSAPALFLLGSRVRTKRLFTKGEPSHSVDFGSSLFRRFLVNELHDLDLIHVG